MRYLNMETTNPSFPDSPTVCCRAVCRHMSLFASTKLSQLAKVGPPCVLVMHLPLADSQKLQYKGSQAMDERDGTRLGECAPAFCQRGL